MGRKIPVKCEDKIRSMGAAARAGHALLDAGDLTGARRVFRENCRLARQVARDPDRPKGWTAQPWDELAWEGWARARISG